MQAEKWDEFVGKCYECMAAKQEEFLTKYHLRTPSVRYDLNVEERNLLFIVPDSPSVMAKVEVAGSFSVGEGTWLCAWANPWIAEGLKQRCQTVKANGERMGRVQLTEPERRVERDEAEQMSAIGCELTGCRSILA